LGDVHANHDIEGSRREWTIQDVGLSKKMRAVDISGLLSPRATG
jgi:hypothetical protein